MPTSGCFSRVPANHAAMRPAGVSTIVEACADGNGASVNTNSSLAIFTAAPCHSIAAPDPALAGGDEQQAAIRTNLVQLYMRRCIGGQPGCQPGRLKGQRARYTACDTSHERRLHNGRAQP